MALIRSKAQNCHNARFFLHFVSKMIIHWGQNDDPKERLEEAHWTLLEPFRLPTAPTLGSGFQC